MPSLVRADVVDCILDDQVYAMEETMRFYKFSLLVGVNALVEFLEARTHDNILWTYRWLNPKVIFSGCRMQPLLLLIGLKCTRPYSPSRVMHQLGRDQDIPPILDLQKDIEYFKDIAKGEIRYEQFWLNATKMGVDSFKIGLDNHGYTQRYRVWLQSIPRGVSRPLLM